MNDWSMFLVGMMVGAMIYDIVNYVVNGKNQND